MAATTESIPQAQVTSTFWKSAQSFQREFLNLMSFGYLDDDAGVFAQDSQHATNIGAASEAAVKVKDDILAAAESSKGVGNVFTYITSPWAVVCLFMAVLLNRTMIYASLRRPLRLPFRVRFLMRIIPILLCLHHTYNLLLAMRCQSSSIYRNGNPNGGLLWHVGHAGTWWMSDSQACQAVKMLPDDEWISTVAAWRGLSPPEDAGSDLEELSPPLGSLHMLWPLYETLCLSQFVEIFSCAVTGRVPAAETGMTLLEHSLAFAEAEAQAKMRLFVIRPLITEAEEAMEGWTIPKITKSEEEKSESKQEEQRIKIYSGKNVAPEVLYIALISALGHLTSHVLGIFNLQSRYRLLSTGVFGIAFLVGFAYALHRGGSSGVLDFPTVCVVGFIPHLLIFTGIAFCAVIYTFALTLSSLFPPPPSPARPSFKLGFDNLRANLTLRSVSINMAEDFYTTLLKLGFMCLTAASEATYLNEGRGVQLPAWTWLESQKAKMLDSQRRMGVAGVRGSGSVGMIETGRGEGPYARERKDVKGLIGSQKTTNGGKWSGAGEMVRGAGVVLVRFTTSWVYRALGRQRREPVVGIELVGGEELSENEPESEESSSLYNRFLRGGLWGETDESGDYIPGSNVGDDASTTSGYSDNEDDRSTIMLTDSEWESESECASGQTTPTQRSPHRRQNHHNHPPTFGEIFSTPHELATLLDPQTPEQRDQARVMARHLTSSQILTRSGYELSLEADRALLHPGQNEETTLESVLLHRRRETHAHDHDEEDDEGTGGPQCVVCQSAPRTILVWPCRCLALCEDCRVCLALNNFANCVTCRSPLEGFSRIYIP